MTEVISIRFKNKGKVYFFDPAGNQIPTDSNVIVETSKGLEYAYCTWGNHWVDDAALVPPLRPVVRLATEEDTKRSKDNKKKEADAFRICQEKIIKHEIDMKLVDVEYNFEGTKILFFFTSDGRVDFRELVKDLASVFHTRIELRQIGVRDEAKMLGGLGICGKPFCCSQFLDEFHPVSIKMAKTQGLSLNPTKISGTCGRLMCCLKYEQVAYEDIVKRAPKADAFVETPGGKGSVASVNLLRGYAKVRLEDSGDTTLKAYTFDELEVLGGKARRAEYIAARAEGRLAEAGFTPSNLREAKIKPGEQPKKEDEAPFVFADGTTATARTETVPEGAAAAQPPKNKRGKRPPNRKPKPQNQPAVPGAVAKDAGGEQPRNSQQPQKGQKRQFPPRGPKGPQSQPGTPRPEQQKHQNPNPPQPRDDAKPGVPADKPASEKKRNRYYRGKKNRPNKGGDDHGGSAPE